MRASIGESCHFQTRNSIILDPSPSISSKSRHSLLYSSNFCKNEGTNPRRVLSIINTPCYPPSLLKPSLSYIVFLLRKEIYTKIRNENDFSKLSINAFLSTVLILIPTKVSILSSREEIQAFQQLIRPILIASIPPLIVSRRTKFPKMERMERSERRDARDTEGSFGTKDGIPYS